MQRTLQLRISLAFALAMLLASCGMTGAHSVCADSPIYTACGDVLSDSTATQILNHNELGAKDCGWKPHKAVCSSGTQG